MLNQDNSDLGEQPALAKFAEERRRTYSRASAQHSRLKGRTRSQRTNNGFLVFVGG